MNFWKFLFVTYLSVLMIEGVPYTSNSNRLANDGDDNFSDILDTFRAVSRPPGQVSLLDKWKQRTSTTAAPTTTIAPGSLADLNLRMKALETQLNKLSDAMVLEQAQIQTLANQLQNMGSLVTAIYNSVISSASASAGSG